MIKEAIEKILSISENKLYEIDGETYSDKNLVRIPPHVDRPNEVSVGSLDGIVKLVKTELDVMNVPLFVFVSNYRTVGVFSTVDEYMGRDHLYEATCQDTDFREGWRNQQAAIIELRSRFVPNEGADYILDLISRMSKEDSVTSDDNGVTQEVTARAGVALKERFSVKPRVVLQPFRTFREVTQPASEFLLRVDNEGQVGFFEADGGMWKLEAKANIAGYLEGELADEIAAHKVVVMM